MGRMQDMAQHTLEPLQVQEAAVAPVRSDAANIIVPAGYSGPVVPKKIWIDIDNSPHVPFFIPIIAQLKKRGHNILLTARDSYQVCELLEFHHLNCEVVGGHWGKNRFLKTMGTLGRAARLFPLARREKPDLAVSLVSRAQLLTCRALGIPMVVTFDYEYVVTMQFLQPDWILVPEVMPPSGAGVAKKGILRYPGLKEDVYVPSFKPDASLKKQLNINENDFLVTLRPPATEAHYHNPESDKLMGAALQFLTSQPGVRVVLLPRNERQADVLRNAWADCIADGKIIFPPHVVDGLNLIWHSDLVISGGGTMNREAAALGVPVYSIFRGKIGAVDRYLEAAGRLVLIESAQDIQSKVILKRRDPASRDFSAGSPALRSISEALISIAEHQCLPPRP
jgi:hypothetical protein